MDSVADTVRLYARVKPDSLECVERLFRGSLLSYGAVADSIIRCFHGNSTTRVVYQRILRRKMAPLANQARITGAPWSQYRGDEVKTARAPELFEYSRGFNIHIGGSVRSSIAIVGHNAIVGTHGTGTIVSIDVQKAMVVWRATVPNWVHEDGVSDGQIVVLGFGDSGPSFRTRAPAGVAAYRVRDGILLWSAFESNSVMSSPVISDGRVTYATAGGLVKMRELNSGELIHQTQLPGAVAMAPPALIGATLVFGAGNGWVCALDATDLSRQWCSRLPGVAETGVAGPAVFDTVIVQSAAQMLDVYHLGTQAAQVGPVLLGRIAADIIVGRSERPVGQIIFGVRVRDGSILWRGLSHPARRIVLGHNSGTATGSRSIGVVVLPIPDLVVAFNPATGTEIWHAEADGSRGPPLVVDSSVYVFSATGSIRVLRIRDGSTACTYRSKFKFDRAGPSLAGTLLLVGTISGEIFGIPRSLIDNCRLDQLDLLIGK
jgi:outer membrane protein assembly factor BamB